MVIRPRFSSVSRYRLWRCLPVALLSLCATIFTPPPQPSQSNFFQPFISAALGQTSITPEEITRYARSILDIEPLRQKAYEQIQENNGSVPLIDCYNSDQLNALNSTIRPIAINYCQQCQQIVEKNGLGPAQFNEITRRQEQDAQFRETIRNEIIQLQEQRSER